MALATCRRCNAVFIVDGDPDAITRTVCPYCGRAMEPISAEEAQRRRSERRSGDEPEDAPENDPEAPKAHSPDGARSAAHAILGLDAGRWTCRGTSTHSPPPAGAPG